MAHLLGDTRNQYLLRFLRRDLAAHEAEDLGLARALEGGHADPPVPDHDLHARLGALKDDAPRPRRFPVDRDRGVHLDVLDRHPPPADQHLGRQVARRVEALREHALALDLLHPDRLFGLRGRAQGSSLPDDPVEQLRRTRRHLHPAQRRVCLVLADLQLFDGEVAAEVHHHVHDLRQRHRVDDVAGQDELRRVALVAHARTPAAALSWAWRAAASRAGLDAYSTLRLDETRQDARSPFHAPRTAASTSPPCAPAPGSRNGRSVAARTSAASAGAVAPTTSPTLP